MIFEDHSDLYFARAQVAERLNQAKGILPVGVEPQMGPVSTGLGEVLMYVVDFDKKAPRSAGKPGFQPDGSYLTVSGERLTDDVAFPYLLLLVSGGHCQLLMVDGVGRYRRLGTTLDDAAGEAFDKTAKLLDLGYPGGPAVEDWAARGDPARFELPRPMLGRPGLDFSFSGLKTAVRHLVEMLPRLDDQSRAAEWVRQTQQLARTVLQVGVDGQRRDAPRRRFARG